MNKKTCHETWQHMNELTKEAPYIRNYTQEIEMDQFSIETELFSLEALDAYSHYNMGDQISDSHQKFFSPERGGGQGDYREGMKEKIANIVDCLRNYPQSKRAIITICNNATAQHSSDDDSKCLRELHFYIEDKTLKATAFFRAQAAAIFPKNIHFIGSVMDRIAKELNGLKVGTLFYHTSILVADRS